MKRRSLWSALLALAAVLALLGAAACGGAGGDSTDAGASQSSGAATSTTDAATEPGPRRRPRDRRPGAGLHGGDRRRRDVRALGGHSGGVARAPLLLHDVVTDVQCRVPASADGLPRLPGRRRPHRRGHRPERVGGQDQRLGGAERFLLAPGPGQRGPRQGLPHSAAVGGGGDRPLGRDRPAQERRAAERGQVAGMAGHARRNIDGGGARSSAGGGSPRRARAGRVRANVAARDCRARPDDGPRAARTHRRAIGADRRAPTGANGDTPPPRQRRRPGRSRPPRPCRRPRPTYPSGTTWGSARRTSP